MTYTDDSTGGRVIKSGICPIIVTLAEGCKVGDLLGYNSGWYRALATTGTAIHAVLVAGQNGNTADKIVAYPAAVVGGISGATAGTHVYLAEGTSYGQTTQTAPSTTGDINAPIGMAVSATEIFLYPGYMPVYSDTDHLA